MSEITIAPKPKRRRGAQPGNLNGSKNPWTTFWRRRAVKESDRWVVPLIENYAAELLDDRGGIEGSTAAERRVIEIAQTARGAAMLLLKECSERGLVVNTDDGWDLAPGAKELSRFLGVELNALRTIGMVKREPTQVTDLQTYIHEKYGSGHDENGSDDAQDADMSKNEADSDET